MRVLIIHTYGMGDMIMFAPTLKKIREKYPNSVIDFLVFQNFAMNPIKKCNFINKIYTSRFYLGSILRIILKLRKNRYDLSIVTSGTSSLKGGLFSFLIGAKERIGEYKRFKNILYSKPIKYIENLHRVENNLLLMGRNNSKKIYPFLCDKIEFQFNINKIKIGFHIGSNILFAKKKMGKREFCNFNK